MYSSLPGFILGFHGCDKAVAENVRQGYNSLLETYRKAGFWGIPENRKMEDGFPMLRHLDCAVMETVHKFREDGEERKFDSVRAMFPEGKELYPDKIGRALKW